MLKRQHCKGTMNNKIQKEEEKSMGFFNTMKDTLTVTSQGVAQKVSSATESAKLNNQIKANQRMIKKIMYHVGEKCYELNGNQTGTPYEELFQEIRRLQEESRSLQGQISILTSENVCPKCGYKNTGGTKFCINCGAMLGQEEVTFSYENGKVCTSCGSVNSPEAMFCVECGNKLEENQENTEDR